MLKSSRRIWCLPVLVVCLLYPVLPAQDDPVSRRAAIEAFYPIMIGALQAKNFGRARNICDQAIMWEPQNPVHHYNLACIEAQAGEAGIPYAWGALELAVALGFNDVDHLQSDADLTPLRSDPRFADLVRKITFHESVGGAIANIKIPDAPAKSPSPGPMTPEPERPAPSEFKDDRPVGLYLMSRYRTSPQKIEQTAWYFAPDGTVYEDLKHGFSQADLASHAGPKGKAQGEQRSLEISWSGGRKSKSDLERDGASFTWEMGIFTPIVGFEDASEVSGIYDGSEVTGAHRLELRNDGTFTWQGSALAIFGSSPPPTSSGTELVTSGRWKLSGLSLLLTRADGTELRVIAFPEDDERTVIKPDRMFLGGLMFKRRP